MSGHVLVCMSGQTTERVNWKGQNLCPSLRLKHASVYVPLQARGKVSTCVSIQVYTVCQRNVNTFCSMRLPQSTCQNACECGDRCRYGKQCQFAHLKCSKIIQLQYTIVLNIYTNELCACVMVDMYMKQKYVHMKHIINIIQNTYLTFLAYSARNGTDPSFDPPTTSNCRVYDLLLARSPLSKNPAERLSQNSKAQGTASDA